MIILSAEPAACLFTLPDKTFAATSLGEGIGDKKTEIRKTAGSVFLFINV
jgi:hypothetical protein